MLKTVDGVGVDGGIPEASNSICPQRQWPIIAKPRASLRGRRLQSFGKGTREFVALINIRDDLPELNDIIFSSQCFCISRCGAESGEAVVRHSLILRNDFDVEKIFVSWR